MFGLVLIIHAVKKVSGNLKFKVRVDKKRKKCVEERAPDNVVASDTHTYGCVDGKANGCVDKVSVESLLFIRKQNCFE